MNLFYLQIILNHSITVAVVLGIARYKRIVKAYRPFLYFIFLGFINETISLVVIESHQSNTINSNFYLLFEYLILLYQFYTWNACPAKQLTVFAGLGVAVWITDNLLVNRMTDANAGFRCYASFVLIFFCIETMKRLIVDVKGNLLREGCFLICVALVLFYGCKAFAEGFHLFHVPFSGAFYNALWITLSVINGISNLIFAIAVLWLPTREEYTLRY